MNLDALAMSELIKSKKEEMSAPTRMISLVAFDTGEPITTTFQSAAFVIYIDGIAYLWNHKDLPQPMQQREWQGLTDEELTLLWLNYHGDNCLADGRILSYEQAIEAKLREKNA